jgi:hypothetical protein
MKDEVGVVKHAVATAKEALWTKHVANVNAIRSSATAWESVKMLRAGSQGVYTLHGPCGGTSRQSIRLESWVTALQR